MPPLLLLLAGFALVAVLLAWSRWLAGRRWASVGHLLLAAAALAAVAGAWPATRHLASYAPYVPGEAFAELYVEQLAAGRFRATLTRLPSGRMQAFDLEGGEWRLDVRTLDWTGRAADLGLAPRLRLERLASRTVGTDGTTTAPATAYSLTGQETGTDWPRAGSPWRRVASAGRQSSPWQSLADDARFGVRLAATGIVVAPLTEPDDEARVVP